MGEKVNYAEAIGKELKEMDIQYGICECKDNILFLLTVGADNAPGLNIKMIIDENGEVRFRCYLASNVVVAKRLAVIEVLNKLNCKYRYICLRLDKAGDVCAAYDLPLIGDKKAACDQVISIMAVFSENCDKCIPDIMRTIWDKEGKLCSIFSKRENN